MEGVPLSAYLTLSIVLFCVGALGVVLRRNPIVIFMCIELMLNAANLAFLAFARYHQTPLAPLIRQQDTYMTGQMAVVFVMAVAAAEVAIGLGIIMAIFRVREDIDIDRLNVMRG
jgi:NADH-quinone oxidoreductase subunit K